VGPWCWDELLVDVLVVLFLAFFLCRYLPILLYRPVSFDFCASDGSAFVSCWVPLVGLSQRWFEILAFRGIYFSFCWLLFSRLLLLLRLLFYMFLHSFL
jgi:hypothetical protein